MTTTQHKTGLFNNIPFPDYLKLDLMSQSVLKNGRVSMAHLKAAKDDPKDITDAMRLGSALHVAFLEPDELDKRVVLWKGKTRSGEAWTKFKEEHDSKVILTTGFHNKMTGMVAALRKQPEVKQWAQRAEGVEVTSVNYIGVTLCRGRCDAITDDPLCDLKKIASETLRKAANNPDRLMWHITQFGYDIQGAMYRRLFNRDRFMLFFCEDQPPYTVVPVELGQKILQDADDEVVRLLDRYEECVESGVWPGPFSEMLKLDRAETITMNGQEIM